MKFVSKAALTAVLLAGSGLVVTPAIAKEKKEESAQAALKVSAEFRTPAAAAEAALKAGDYATAKTQLDAAAAVAKTDDEKYYLASMRLPVAAKEKDVATEIAALDTLLASSRTSQADLAKFSFVRGTLALDAKDPTTALTYLTKARQLGWNQQDVDLLIARSYFDSNQVAQGVAAVDAAIKNEEAAGRKAPEAWYKYVVAKLYKAGDMTGTSQWLGRQIQAYPSAEAWRNAILIYRQSDGSDALHGDNRINLYRLQRATGALADQKDYWDYADLANKSGLPAEAVAVIDEGRAKGKIPSSQADFNSLYTSAKRAAANEGSLAPLEKQALASANGKLAGNTADAYLATGNYAKATELYRAALQKGGAIDKDAINTSLGIALAKQGQKAEAKAAFQAVQGKPAVDVANFWMTYLDLPAAGAPAAS